MRRIPLLAASGFAVGSVLFGSGCDRSGPTARPTPAKAVVLASQDPAQVRRGQALFTKHCTVCHGESGDGQGRFAYLMNPRPRDFLRANFKLTSTMNLVPTDADLLATIGRGMPGSAMPPWSHLPEDELRALVAYVRHLGVEVFKADMRQAVEDGDFTESESAEEIAIATVPGEPIPIPPEPKFDEEHWFEGRRLYLEGCAACHGESGEPDPSTELQQDSDGYPVSPRSFVRGVFKGGSDGPALYARIFKGMAATPMPASEGNFTGEQFWHMVHYIQSLAQAGSQERAWLRRATITAKAVAPGALPAEPVAPEWNAAPPTYVSLTPLWWRHDRIEGLMVQAMHDQTDLVIRLTWIDPVADEQAVRVQDFRDGVAIQFSAAPDPPFYMGQTGPGGGVTLWYWKADRQRDLADGHQDEDDAYPQRVVDMYQTQVTTVAALAKIQGNWPRARIADHDPTFITGWGAGNMVSDPKRITPVETLEARGPGTLSARPPIDQVVKGQGVYSRGAWYVQMRRSMTPPEHTNGEPNGATAPQADCAPITFEPGARVPLSFAIWDGHAGDRDGKKQISIWQELVIE